MGRAFPWMGTLLPSIPRRAGTPGVRHPRTLSATPVPRERFEALARARAAALREALVTGRGVEAGRVRVAEDVSEGDPGVELELAAAVGELVGAPEPPP